ncbi:MAG: SDR family NAD(P)-dependent oxidoreductase, partial [Candidatus Aminicenantales bacterium]
MHSIKNKVVFVTGASAGIGKSCARAFARQGASILMCARRSDRVKGFAAELKREFGVPVHQFSLDVRDQPAVEKAVAGLSKDWRA